MITLYAKELCNTHFGIAYCDERIVATTTDSTKEQALENLISSIPPRAKYQCSDKGSSFAEQTVLMLKELHLGNEKSKTFTLATEYFSKPTAKVLQIAAQIPIGYVTSYGQIARIAGTGPRVVGRIMATNPIYPLVPCHRVVGADFSLVGYGGRKTMNALDTKLTKLRKECKGFNAAKDVPVDGKKLTVYPVEYVIKQAEKRKK